jgi:hypothetical protein
MVLDALVAGKGPLSPSRINTHRRIRSSSGAFELDAIIETQSTDYIVEIKYSKRPHILINALAAAERGATAYRAYLDERGVLKEVIPFAVIPADVYAPALFRDVLPILKFDSADRKFVNEKEFLDAVRIVRSQMG